MATFSRAVFEPTVFDCDAAPFTIYPRLIDVEVDDPDIAVDFDLSSRDLVPSIELLDEAVSVDVGA